MNGVMDGAKILFSTMVENLHKNLEVTLQNELSEKQLTTIDTVFNDVVNPFENLETKSQQNKYITEELHYLVSDYYNNILILH